MEGLTRLVVPTDLQRGEGLHPRLSAALRHDAASLDLTELPGLLLSTTTMHLRIGPFTVTSTQKQTA